MKKEVLLAIIIGFLMGLIIVFGVWQANKTFKTIGLKGEVSPSPESTITSTPAPTVPSSALIITFPEDNFLSNKEKIEIKGKAPISSSIVILYEEGEKIIEADEEGNFQTEITLVGGDNEITISAYTPEGEEITKTLNVVYSTAEI